MPPPFPSPAPPYPYQPPAPPPPSPLPPVTPGVIGLDTVIFPPAYLSIGATYAADGLITLSVNASYSRAAPLTLFDLNGLTAIVVPGDDDASTSDTLTFSNQSPFAAQRNCSLRVYLGSADPAFASWPAFVRASLLFTVDASGRVMVPTLGGVAFKEVGTPSAIVCQPAVFSPALLLGYGFTSLT